MARLTHLLQQLSEIPVRAGRYSGLQERINAIQEAIKAIARGENIEAGVNLRKQVLNPHSVVLSGQPGGGRAGSFSFPLRASTKREDQSLFATVEKGHVLDYTQGQTPAVIDIEAFEQEIDAEGIYLAYLVLTIDYENGKKVLDGEARLHQGEDLPEPEDDEIFLLIAGYEIGKESNNLTVEDVEQVQAGAIPYNVLPTWAKYEAEEKKLTIGGDPESEPNADSAVVVEEIDLRVEKDGINRLSIAEEDDKLSIKIGDESSAAGNRIEITEQGLEDAPQITLQAGQSSVIVIGETPELDGLGFEVKSGDSYGILRPGSLDIKESGGGELSIDANEIDGVISVKKLTVNSGESSEEFQIIADQDVTIEIDPEEGEGVPWADFDGGNLNIGGNAPEETVENISIEATKTLQIKVGEIDIRANSEASELNGAQIGKVGINIQDFPGVHIDRGNDNEANFDAELLEFANGGKSVDLRLEDLPAGAEVKFREVLVCDGASLAKSYIPMTEPEAIT